MRPSVGSKRAPGSPGKQGVGDGHQVCGPSALSPGPLASLQNTFPSRELSWLPRWVFYDHQVRRGPNSSVGTRAALFGVCLASSPSQQSQQSGRSLGGTQNGRPPSPLQPDHPPRPPQSADQHPPLRGSLPSPQRRKGPTADSCGTKGLACQDVASHFCFKGSSLKRKKEKKKNLP